MRIIVDGPNNVGKSTFISTMNKYLNLEEVRCSDHSKISRDYFIDVLSENNVILDRGPISELVYSSIYNREFNLTISDIDTILDRCMSNKDDLYIILLSDKKTLHNNYSLKGEKDFCENNDKFIDQELNLFSKYGVLFNCYIVENYTFDKLDVVLNAIFKTLSK